MDTGHLHSLLFFTIRSGLSTGVSGLSDASIALNEEEAPADQEANEEGEVPGGSGEEGGGAVRSNVPSSNRVSSNRVCMFL